MTFKHVFEKLIAVHGKSEEGRGKFPSEFHNKEATVEVTAKEFPSSPKQSMTIKIEVQTTQTRNYHWEDSNNPEVLSPKHFTAIGCLETPLKNAKNENENHAVYIKSYNPEKAQVETINSWGIHGELGPLNDTKTTLKGGPHPGSYEFYQVD